MTDIQLIAEAITRGLSLAQKRWLTKEDVAAYLGIGESTFDREVAKHIGVTRATSGKPLFDRLEIDQFLENRKVNKDD